jgi:osmotically-inducible protein OsmY
MLKTSARWTSLPMALALLAIAAITVGCNTSEPPNQQMKDLQITAQVKTKLASDVRASSLTNIDVNTTNGVVTLAGQVENPGVKHSAESVAGAVAGVVRVNNNLQVASANSSAAH